MRTQISGVHREAVLANMAHAGRELSIQWGHEPWSKSWGDLVAKTMLEAAEQMLKVLGSHPEDGQE